MPPFHIIILSDDRPGHYNLAEGIAAAIERLRPARTTRIKVARGRWPGPVLAALTRARLPAAAMLRAVYGLEAAGLPACDLIVSAGAETLAANVWLARLRRVPNLFYGSLRQFDPRDFALVLTSYGRNAGRPNHLVCLKPSRLDPDAIGPPAPVSGTAGRLPPHTAGLLVGGSAAGYTWSERDWRGLADFIAASHRAHGTRWIVSNSRRTPDAASDLFLALAGAAGGPIARFIDVRTGGGPLRDLLAASEAVVVTEDSSSMVSEAVWSRRPVVVVRPAAAAMTADEAAYREMLADDGRTRTLPIAGLTPAVFLEALSLIEPLRENPLDLLARQLADRVPGLVRGY